MAYLVDWDICDLLTPERLAVDKAAFAASRALLVDDHTARIARCGRLHDASSLWLQCLLRITVNKSVEEGNESVERNIRGAGERFRQ